EFLTECIYWRKSWGHLSAGPHPSRINIFLRSVHNIVSTWWKIGSLSASIDYGGTYRSNVCGNNNTRCIWTSHYYGLCISIWNCRCKACIAIGHNKWSGKVCPGIIVHDNMIVWATHTAVGLIHFTVLPSLILHILGKTKSL